MAVNTLHSMRLQVKRQSKADHQKVTGSWQGRHGSALLAEVSTPIDATGSSRSRSSDTRASRRNAGAARSRDPPRPRQKRRVPCSHRTFQSASRGHEGLAHHHPGGSGVRRTVAPGDTRVNESGPMTAVAALPKTLSMSGAAPPARAGTASTTSPASASARRRHPAGHGGADMVRRAPHMDMSRHRLPRAHNRGHTSECVPAGTLRILLSGT